MNPVFLQIENFCCIGNTRISLAHQGLVQVIGENHDTDAAISNGSGKTTLFKALSWCWYGETIDGDKGDEVIRKGEKETKVETGFSDDKGKIWIVSRERKKGKPRVELKDVNGVSVKLSKSDIQHHIENNIVGLDFQAFKNSVLYGQNDHNRFAYPGTSDAQRKSMLHKILKTVILQKCYECAKKRRLDLKKKSEMIEHDIYVVELKHNESDVALSMIKEDLSEWEEKKKKSIDLRKQKLSALLVRIKENSNCVADLDNLRKQDEDIDKEIEESKKTQVIISEIDGELVVLGKRIQSFLIKQGEVESSHKRKISQLEQFNEGKCPTCNSSVKNECVQVHVKAIEADIDLLLQKVYDVSNELEKFCIKRDMLEKRRNLLVGNANKIVYFLERKSDIGTKIAAIENLEQHNKDLKAMADEVMVEIKSIVSETNPYTERLKSAEKKIHECNKKIKALRVELVSNRDELAHIQFWVKGFSNQGLPSYILDSVMPFVTKRANHYLEILTDGDIEIEFRTQRELKSQPGEARDEIDIRWTIEGQDDVAPSGGQQKKIEIATDLALMDLVSSRESGGIDLLIMDEVLDGLDGEGRERVVLLLQEIRSRRGSIFVISHESDLHLAGFFDKTLNAIKRDGVTEFEKVVA